MEQKLVSKALQNNKTALTYRRYGCYDCICWIACWPFSFFSPCLALSSGLNPNSHAQVEAGCSCRLQDMRVIRLCLQPFNVADGRYLSEQFINKSSILCRLSFDALPMGKTLPWQLQLLRASFWVSAWGCLALLQQTRLILQWAVHCAFSAHTTNLHMERGPWNKFRIQKLQRRA